MSLVTHIVTRYLQAVNKSQHDEIAQRTAPAATARTATLRTANADSQPDTNKFVVHTDLAINTVMGHLSEGLGIVHADKGQEVLRAAPLSQDKPQQSPNSANGTAMKTWVISTRTAEGAYQAVEGRRLRVWLHDRKLRIFVDAYRNKQQRAQVLKDREPLQQMFTELRGKGVWVQWRRGAELWKKEVGEGDAAEGKWQRVRASAVQQPPADTSAGGASSSAAVTNPTTAA